MSTQRPRLLVSQFTRRIYLVTRYREHPGGLIENTGPKVDVTDEVGRAIAELDRMGYKLTAKVVADDGGADAA